MSSNSENGTQERPPLDNPETAEQIREARAQVETQREEEKMPGQRASPGELHDARSNLADEDQPGYEDLPQPETKTATWRGTDLEFNEMGDALGKIQSMDEDPDVSTAELNDYAYTVFAKKCQHPAADESYWRQFDLMRDDDTDGLLDLFARLAGGEDELPDDASEAAERFRDERGGGGNA